jgi:hypothetical protein
MFFFGKKNQKTSPPASPLLSPPGAPKAKKEFFCFFVFKQRRLPS